jgi:lipoprotein-releasing system ATP-binding protein
MSLLRIEALVKSYRTGSETVEVLRKVSFSVEEATTVVISGESGSGKTTLLSLIGGLDSPTAGRIFVGGKDISNLAEDKLVEYRSLTVGFVFQFHFLLKDFTALENVMMPSYIVGGSTEAAREKALGLLESVGLRKRSSHFPLELSGGERQRVAVARALMNVPSIILADEPTGNLDEKNSEVVEDLLFQLVEKHGKTLILVTHDRSIARRADQHFELVHGSVVKQ